MAYNTLQLWLENGDTKTKFWGLLVSCVLVYIGMIAGISFLPKKKENSNTYDIPAIIGWVVMVLLLILSTWIMVLMNPHGTYARLLSGENRSEVFSASSSDIEPSTYQLIDDD